MATKIEMESQRDAEAQLQFQEFTPSSAGVAELDVKTFPNDHIISPELGSQSDMESKESKGGWLCCVHESQKSMGKIPLLDQDSVQKCSYFVNLPWSLKPVLPHELIGDVESTDVYVCRILDSKKISYVMEVLSKISPIFGLGHLKRVTTLVEKGLCVILCEANGFSEDSCVTLFKEKGFSFDGLDPIPFKVSVPSVIPKTRKQYENASAMWSCNFTVDKYIEKIIDGSIFDANDRKFQEHYMDIAYLAAEKSLEMNGVGVGCVIVDPVKSSIVAIAYDRRLSHPLKHAVMVAADLTARVQGGGRWPVEEGMWISPAKIERRVPCKRTKDFSFGDLASAYLCTGYDVYLTREPCAMCAMALVHCRARRVFFGCFNEGALGGKMKLHEMRGLNHCLEVFSGLHRRKCDRISCSVYKG